MSNSIITGEHYTIHVGDVRESLRKLPKQSVHCVVTSPPYWGLRDYNFEGQIGSEATPHEYVQVMIDVFRLVRDVLRDDGVLFLNLGDSYAASGRGGGGGSLQNDDVGTKVSKANSKRAPATGFQQGDKIGIPWRVALALQEDGWILRQDMIWCLSGGTWLYARTEKGDAPAMLKDLVRLDPATVQLWNGKQWTRVVKWTQNRPPKKTAQKSRNGFLEIEFRNGERVGCTAEHLWPCKRGLLPASELVVGDVVPTCQLPEPKDSKSLCLSDVDMGWLVGFYLAEGNPTEKGMRFSVHSSEYAEFERIRGMAERVDGTATFNRYEGDGATIDVYSQSLRELVCQYVSGTTSHNKRLTRKSWMRPNVFLESVVSGYLDGDGHYDQKNERWRIGFTQNDGLAVDLRTAFARLGYSHRLSRSKHKNQLGSYPGWRGDVRKVRSPHGNSRVDGEIVSIRKSRARVYWDVTVADEPHTFALASGLLTHNCKPSPMPESVSGWRWQRCQKKIGKSKRASDKKALTTPNKPHGDRDGKDFASAAEYEPCPGCKKCQGNNGMVLRRGSWRPTTSHEYIFMFVKSPNYFCDGDGSKEPASGTAHSRGKGVNPKASQNDAGSRQNDSFSAAVKEIVKTRNLRSVWRISTEPFPGAHFATFPTELPRLCLSAAISPGGCCSACGSQYAPVVSSERVATRPGTNSKVNRASDDAASHYHGHSGSIVGNRDPQRHTTTTEVAGYLPTCRCKAPVSRPSVLDPFGGSMTTGQVAINIGCDFIGLEGNPDYVQLGLDRLQTPWKPVAERRAKKEKRPKRNRSARLQGVLVFEGE